MYSYRLWFPFIGGTLEVLLGEVSPAARISATTVITSGVIAETPLGDLSHGSSEAHVSKENLLLVLTLFTSVEQWEKIPTG